MGKITEGFVKSSARIKRVAIARERDSQRNLAVVEKNLTQALKEIEEMKDALRAKEEDNERVSTERDSFKNELEVEKENLAKKASENGRLKEEVNQTKKENGMLKENNEKMNTNIDLLRQKVQSGEATHAKEKVEFQRQMKKVKCELSSERSTNLGLSKALDIHSDVSLRRDKLNADVEETEEVARQAKRSRDNFENGPAKEIRRVDLAVGFLERGELECGEKLIDEIETKIAPERKKWLETKNDKRKRLRAENKQKKEEGEVADADGSLLMVEGGDEGGGAHRDQMELSIP